MVWLLEAQALVPEREQAQAPGLERVRGLARVPESALVLELERVLEQERVLALVQGLGYYMLRVILIIPVQPLPTTKAQV